MERYPKCYEEGRRRRCALRPYPNAASVLDAMRFASKLSYRMRDAVTAALVLEQQRAPHPQWLGLLLCAYAPMLRGLLRRTKDLPEPDTSARIVLAFAEAVQSTKVMASKGAMAVVLRRETARGVFEAIRREREECAGMRVSFESLDHELPEQDDAVLRTESAAQFMVWVQRSTQGAETLTAYLETRNGQSLRDYVARRYQDLPAGERALAYRRLQRNRHRMILRLRGRMRKASRESTSKAA